MARQGGKGRVKGIGQPMSRRNRIRRIARNRYVKAAPGVEQGLQMGVDRMVIPVEQVDAGRNVGLDLAEHRKIVPALDTMMTVQVLQEGLQRRDQLGVKAPGVGRVGPESRSQRRHMIAVVAEAGVHLQPVRGDGVQPGLAPTAAWKAVSEGQPRGRKPLPASQVEGVRQPPSYSR